MPVRRLPVRPNLDQLHRQAKELLSAIHAGEANAIAELRDHHPESIVPAAAKLADAQLVLARSYDASSWTRLVHAVRLADAIWRDDLDTVRALITGNPALVHEHVLIESTATGTTDVVRGKPGSRRHHSLASRPRRERPGVSGRPRRAPGARRHRAHDRRPGWEAAREVDARRSPVHAERGRHRGPAHTRCSRCRVDGGGPQHDGAPSRDR